MLSQYKRRLSSCPTLEERNERKAWNFDNKELVSLTTRLRHLQAEIAFMERWFYLIYGLWKIHTV